MILLIGKNIIRMDLVRFYNFVHCNGSQEHSIEPLEVLNYHLGVKK